MKIVTERFKLINRKRVYCNNLFVIARHVSVKRDGLSSVELNIVAVAESDISIPQSKWDYLSINDCIEFRIFDAPNHLTGKPIKVLVKEHPCESAIAQLPLNFPF